MRWVLELMRLSRMSQAERIAQISETGAEPFHRTWQESKGLVIVGAQLFGSFGILASVPLGRLGMGADIGAAVVYLASNEAGYVTGQTLHVNGGMAMI